MISEILEDKYEEGNLKEYTYWLLTVSFRQTTLGSYIILAKRPVEKISELLDEELIELRHVMAEIEQVLSAANDFKPDRFNYLQLGNSLHQLHFHGIPRYSTPRNFAGKEWIDSKYGTTPVILKKSEESEVTEIRQIRDTLKPYFK